ncbi:hypothetical protein EW145_g3700 [Phellinidium pouzarii]|uniref:Uncharacterized protein n=1 Tax=Phellinidium pouzarii TaxID=167371 RepID=A0A4S4LBF5_9AGAM|nr:hypothetical protein EW145_g3700 [Phellinidium pouzarii]
MWKPIRCFFPPGYKRDATSDSPMGMSSSESTQSDTTTEGLVHFPSLEATASPSASTSRTTRTSETFTEFLLNSGSVPPPPQMMTTETNVRAGEYFKFTPQNTGKVFTPQVITPQVPVQPSQPPRRTELPPAVKNIPVADIDTLRTLLGLIEIMQTDSPAPVWLSSPPRLQPWHSYVIEQYELAVAKVLRLY